LLTIADAAVNPAYPKNFRLLNISVVPILYWSHLLNLEQSLTFNSISHLSGKGKKGNLAQCKQEDAGEVLSEELVALIITSWNLALLYTG
jgi:hypothetical protein